MRKCFLVMLALLLIAVPAVAQDDSTTVYLRLAHFSVDAQSIDVHVNGSLFLEAVPFSDVSAWVELEAGSYTVDIVPAGASIDDAILSADYDLNAGDWVSLAAIGLVADNTLAIQAIVDDLNDIPEGMTFVTVFHAIANLEPVTFFAGDTEFASLLSYPGMLVDSDGFMSDMLLAGDYDFEFEQDDTSVLSVETGTLGAGRAYLLALVGTASNPQYIFVSTDVDAIIRDEIDPLAELDPGEGSLLIRLGHFSVSARAVDIYLNGDNRFQDVQFGDVSDYMEFEAGIYDLALVPTGESLEEALYEGQIILTADSITLIAAVGFVENGSLEVVTATEEVDAPEPNFSRIAFFQAIPSLELFDLKANDNILIQGLTYPDAFDGAGDGYTSVDIVTDVYEFVVEGAGNTLNVGNVTTGSGRVYLIVSTGIASSPIFFLISEDFPAEE